MVGLWGKTVGEVGLWTGILGTPDVDRYSLG